MSYTDWRVYQEAIVEVFRRLGCNALIDYRGKGNRAAHDIDVFAIFLRTGSGCRIVAVGG